MKASVLRVWSLTETIGLEIGWSLVVQVSESCILAATP